MSHLPKIEKEHFITKKLNYSEVKDVIKEIVGEEHYGEIIDDVVIEEIVIDVWNKLISLTN